MLRLEGLAVSYGSRRAVNGIDLHVEDGEFVTLLGANGAGKSTTLRTISGLLKPATGRILFAGEEISGRSPSAIVAMGIAHSPEGRKVWPHLTVEENLLLGGFVHRRRRDLRQDVERIFDLYPRLRERHRQHASTLSGGEQQMVAIGRALMAQPKLLILDEPSLGLAPVMIDRTADLITSVHRSGITVLMVEQNASLALEMSERAYVLERGRIALEGQSSELLRSDYIKKTYLGVADEPH